MFSSWVGIAMMGIGAPGGVTLVEPSNFPKLMHREYDFKLVPNPNSPLGVSKFFSFSVCEPGPIVMTLKAQGFMLDQDRKEVNVPIPPTLEYVLIPAKIPGWAGSVVNGAMNKTMVVKPDATSTWIPGPEGATTPQQGSGLPEGGKNWPGQWKQDCRLELKIGKSSIGAKGKFQLTTPFPYRWVRRNTVNYTELTWPGSSLGSAFFPKLPGTYVIESNCVLNMKPPAGVNVAVQVPYEFKVSTDSGDLNVSRKIAKEQMLQLEVSAEFVQRKGKILVELKPDMDKKPRKLTLNVRYYAPANQ